MRKPDSRGRTPASAEREGWIGILFYCRLQNGSCQRKATEAYGDRPTVILRSDPPGCPTIAPSPPPAAGATTQVASGSLGGGIRDWPRQARNLAVDADFGRPRAGVSPGKQARMGGLGRGELDYLPAGMFPPGRGSVSRRATEWYPSPPICGVFVLIPLLGKGGLLHPAKFFPERLTTPAGGGTIPSEASE